MKKSFKLAAITLSLIAGVSVVSIPFVRADEKMAEGVPYTCNEDGTLTPAPHIEGNYEVNENGQTYGVAVGNYFEDFPDLQPVLGDHGIEGYVYTEELLHKGAAKNPEEAVAQMEAKANGTYEPVVMNVYESDGVTVIDTFTETVSE
ncbi:MAG: hypothetical protein NC205_01260 [Prevotella sp.]|nr:hypothetical protein [Alistipes senegalensis]MCM1357193.1 hypothetical protein [Prevotella sp.]